MHRIATLLDRHWGSKLLPWLRGTLLVEVVECSDGAALMQVLADDDITLVIALEKPHPGDLRASFVLASVRSMGWTTPFLVVAPPTSDAWSVTGRVDRAACMPADTPTRSARQIVESLLHRWSSIDADDDRRRDSSARDPMAHS